MGSIADTLNQIPGFQDLMKAMTQNLRDQLAIHPNPHPSYEGALAELEVIGWA